MNLERWQQADKILQEALAAEELDRSNLLDTACGDDRDLREEVESLLRHAAAPLPWLDLPDQLTENGENRLQKVGPWRLGRLLGEGGMSLVFEGERDDHHFERRVAVKILKQALLTHEPRSRFQMEVRTLARLEHPGIARLYDAGTTEEGLPYLVLELVEGQPLDHWWRAEFRSLEERLDLLCQVCEAVSFAHRNLVVHRDLKPSNILVTKDGVAKLLDFGIASLLPGGRLDSPQLTRTGQQPMTPQYASPEQLLGHTVTTASDVFSLGMVLYELLTDTLPYELKSGSKAEAAGLLKNGLLMRRPSAVLRQSRTGDPRRKRLAQRVKGDLDAIVSKALAETPARRYPSAEAFLTDLRRFRSSLPVAARSPSTSYLLGRFVRRHRSPVAAAAAAAVLVLGFAFTMASTARELARERNHAQTEAATAQAVVKFLGGLFEGAQPDIHQGREITVRELLDRGAGALMSERDQPPATEASLAAAIGKAYFELSLLDEARPFLERSLDLRQHQIPIRRDALAESELLLARLEFRSSHYSNAITQAERALSNLDGAPQRLQAEALVVLGKAQVTVGQLDPGAASLKRALDLLGEPTQEPTLAAAALQELGEIQMIRGQDSSGVELLSSALALLRSVHGDSHPQVLDCRRSLAQRWWLEPERAEVEFLEILAAQRALFGGPHEHLIRTLSDLGVLWVTYGQLDKAVPILRETLAMQEELLGENHFRLAVTLSALASSMTRKGENLEAALPLFRRSLAITRENVEPDSINLAFPQMYLGYTLCRLDRPTEGERLLAEALRIFEKHRPRDDPHYLRARF